MKRTIAALATLVVFGFVVVLSLTPDLKSQVVDANGPDVFSFEEARATVPDLTESQFKTFDTDGNGVLDKEEFAAMPKTFN